MQACGPAQRLLAYCPTLHWSSHFLFCPIRSEDPFHPSHLLLAAVWLLHQLGPIHRLPAVLYYYYYIIILQQMILASVLLARLSPNRAHKLFSSCFVSDCSLEIILDIIPGLTALKLHL